VKRRNVYLLIFILVVFGFALWSIVPLDRNVFGRHGLSLGLDLRGGSQVVYSANLSAKDPAETDAEALQGAKLTIERRVNAYGISEATVQIVQNADGDFLQVQLPGVNNTAEVLATIGQTAELTFKEQATAPNGTTIWVPATATGSNGQQEELTGKYLKPNVTVQTDTRTGKPVVAFEWNAEGTLLFKQITTRDVGKLLGIFLDNQEITAPKVNEPITDGKGVIENQAWTLSNIDEPRTLAIQLNSGALPVPLTLVAREDIEATLGADSIHRSLTAAEIGVVILLIFLLLYYRLPGLVACLALGIYGVVLLMIFKLVPVTLTLPGLAGFIVSFGMAVDANVLIFERMKEELRGGRSLGAAVEAGFSRAWPAIRDSNITTFIACIVLFWLGGQLGALPVRGFAITLFIGVALSMFTAITVSRTFLRLIMGGRRTTNLALYGVAPLRPAENGK
jgi:preprotein translocase subunit SecD